MITTQFLKEYDAGNHNKTKQLHSFQIFRSHSLTSVKIPLKQKLEVQQELKGIVLGLYGLTHELTNSFMWRNICSLRQVSV